MGRIEFKSIGLGCPNFADVFEGREVLEGLQHPRIIVGIDEVVEMRSQLGVSVAGSWPAKSRRVAAGYCQTNKAILI